ncbi:class I SAM-dependent methyltransferase [Nocardioides ultimimeridianus]
MSEQNSPDLALSFGGVVDAYDRARPGYPLDAARWLTGDADDRPLTVLELGAGTGKLTEQLLALGHDVHATEPDPQMFDRLTQRFPEMRVTQSSAEEIPVPDSSIDVVVVGQAYHWFDKEIALPEIARVLKRGGHLALAWNIKDESIPWVRRLGRLLGVSEAERTAGPDEALEASPYFGIPDEAIFKHWQIVDRDSIQDLALSRSTISTLPQGEREAKIREVLAFYDDFGRGYDGMQLPYLTKCYRAMVAVKPHRAPRPAVEVAAEEPGESLADVTRENPAVVDTMGAGLYAGEETVPLAANYVRDYDTGSLPAQDIPGISEPPADDDSGVLLINFR